MAVTNKVKALLNLTGKKPADIAASLDISVQAVRNKLSRNSFSADDLIKIADCVGAELAFTIGANQKVILDINDIN